MFSIAIEWEFSLCEVDFKGHYIFNKHFDSIRFPLFENSWSFLSTSDFVTPKELSWEEHEVLTYFLLQTFDANCNDCSWTESDYFKADCITLFIQTVNKCAGTGARNAFKIDASVVGTKCKVSFYRSRIKFSINFFHIFNDSLFGRLKRLFWIVEWVLKLRLETLLSLFIKLMFKEFYHRE